MCTRRHNNDRFYQWWPKNKSQYYKCKRNTPGYYENRCRSGHLRADVAERIVRDYICKMMQDENYLIDLDNGEYQVMGVGQVTVRRRGYETIYPTGTTFDLDQLKGTTSPKIPATVGDLPADWREWPDDLENDTASEGPFIELLIRV